MANLIEGLFRESIPGLKKQLDLTARRNEAIASNIANAETPQYRAVDLSFGGELERAFNRQEQALARTDPRHIDITTNSGAKLVPDYSGATKPDGNNVDLDVQMGRLAFNSGKYTAAASLIRKQLLFLKNAVREAGR